MKALKRLSFRHKMVAMPIVAGLAFCMVLAAVLVLGRKSQSALQQIEVGHYPAVELNRDLQLLLSDLQRQLQDAASMEDPSELRVADELRDRFRARVRQGGTNPVIRAEQLEDLDRQILEYYGLARGVTARMIGGEFDESFTTALAQMTTRYNEIHSALEEGTRSAEQAIREAFEAAADTQRDLVLAIASILLVCMLAIGATSRLVAAGVTKPVTEAMRVAEMLSRGDLTTEFGLAGDPDTSTRTQDEVGSLMLALGQMSTSLRNLVCGVHAHTEAVSDVTASLHTSSTEMSETISRQERAVGEATRSVERVSLSVQEVTENIDSLSSAASRASSSALELDTSFKETVSLIDQQSESVDSATSAVTELTTSIGQIASSAQLLSASTDSTTHTLQALAKAVVDVEQSAQHTHDLTRVVCAQAERGMEKVEETCHSMDDIQASYRGLEEVVSNLSEKSRAIGEINRVIEGVLEQTHLLALNATIISAQAGEHGKAFAVVAQQVSSLAERTTGSTQKIRTLIDGLQHEVEDAVEGMAGGSKRIDLGVSLSREAGVLLEEIRDSTKECTTDVDEIVASTSRQARDIGQVIRAMVELRDAAEQSDGATREQERASNQIRQAMEQLGELAHRIRSTGHEQSKASQVISSVIEEVAARIQQIADAAEEQGRGGSEIREAIQVFRQAVTESSARAEMVANTVDTLLQRSQDLESEVERFVI